ncbi:synaptonemal complex protein ZEP1-like isoform X2 [Wolffia australiana]
MQKSGLIGMKSLDQLRLAKGSTNGNAKTASANSKLKRTKEHIKLLEGKFREAINENAKLRVKQKEDAKLWNGLDSKLSSTKMFCDQLTETLQRLAGLTQDAEKDKKYFEEMLSSSSNAFDDLKCQFIKLSEKMDYAEKMIKLGKEDMMKLEEEKKEIETKLREEGRLNSNLLTERDAISKQLKEAFEENKSNVHSLNAQLEELKKEVESKDGVCRNLRDALENLKDESNALKSRNKNLSLESTRSIEQSRNLEKTLHGLSSKAEEMDRNSIILLENVSRLFASFQIFEEMVEKKNALLAINVQRKYEEIHNQYQNALSENESLKGQIELLTEKTMELQKAQEFLMVQHAEECRLMEEKVRKVQSESDSISSKNNTLEPLVTQLQEKNLLLSDSHSQAERKMKELQQNASKLESENLDLKNKIQLMSMEKDEMSILQNTIETQKEKVELLESQISELLKGMEEKDKTNMEFSQKEKLLEEQKSEVQESLALAESRLSEAKKQYELMLEAKQSELSKHLKEISQRNDQAINDIRKKYEMEKSEIVSIEKAKIDKLISDMEKKFEDRLTKIKEEEQKRLHSVKEEHDALIKKIRMDFDMRETKIRSSHLDEMQRAKMEAENEIKEKMASMRKEYDMQMQVLRHQHEDSCRILREELELLKSKEERQRTLLQLQRKVMDEKSQQNDMEVNSKKEYSVSSRKMRDPNIVSESQISINRQAVDDCNMGTPVVSMIKKIKETKGDQVNIPKHRKKVTHHEYEIETSNGHTITKRRKTKSTVMFGEPTSRKRVNLKSPTVRADENTATKARRGRPAAIGDLFSESSLNPYAEDPYAFD